MFLQVLFSEVQSLQKEKYPNWMNQHVMMSLRFLLDVHFTHILIVLIVFHCDRSLPLNMKNNYVLYEAAELS